MSELKPCPFCGASAKLWRWNGGTRIDCSEWDSKKHLVGVYGKTDEEAVENWNGIGNGWITARWRR